MQRSVRSILVEFALLINWIPERIVPSNQLALYFLSVVLAGLREFEVFEKGLKIWLNSKFARRAFFFKKHAYHLA